MGNISGAIYDPPSRNNLPNIPAIKLTDLSDEDPLLIPAWNEFDTMRIQDMRRYACRPNTLAVMKTRFNHLSMAISRAKERTVAAGAPRILLFPGLRSKKIFVLKEIASVHGTVLEVLAGVMTRRPSWIVMNGDEAIPTQQDIDDAFDTAAQAARYAVEHRVVNSIVADNRC